MAPSLTHSDEPLFEKCCRAPRARDGFAGVRVGSAIAYRRHQSVLRARAERDFAGRLFTVHRRNDLQPFGSHFRCRARWTGDRARARDFSRLRRGAGSVGRRCARAGHDAAERDSPGHSRAAVRHLARHRNLVEDRARGRARRRVDIFSPSTTASRMSTNFLSTACARSAADAWFCCARFTFLR